MKVFVSHNLGLILVALVALSSSASSAFFCSASVIDATETTNQNPPWWNVANAKYDAVDPDFSWNNRRTGVTDRFKSGLGMWSHFNRSALVQANTASAAVESASAQEEQVSSESPIPWTAGLMIKSLKQVNETAFRLHSVYEPAAQGKWLKGYMQARAADGLLEHSHVFQKTPYRVTNLPMQRHPSHWPAAASTSRVTIVQPDAATVSCPRWLPDDVEQSAELLAGDYERMEFAELWLAETVDGIPEACKVGLFVLYNGVTGELQQVFLMRESALPADLVPADPATATFDLREMANTLRQRRWAPWVRLQQDEQETVRQEAPVSSRSMPARQLASGTPVGTVLRDNGWTMSGRVVKTGVDCDGPETAFQVKDLQCDYRLPVPAGDLELYFDIRCSDGVYFRIPKTFHPTHLAEDVCLELGCLRTDGTGLHRVLVTGSRSQGSLNTAVYERWSAGAEK